MPLRHGVKQCQPASLPGRVPGARAILVYSTRDTRKNGSAVTSQSHREIQDRRRASAGQNRADRDAHALQTARFCTFPCPSPCHPHVISMSSPCPSPSPCAYPPPSPSAAAAAAGMHSLFPMVAPTHGPWPRKRQDPANPGKSWRIPGAYWLPARRNQSPLAPRSWPASTAICLLIERPKKRALSREGEKTARCQCQCQGAFGLQEAVLHQLQFKTFGRK